MLLFHLVYQKSIIFESNFQFFSVEVNTNEIDTKEYNQDGRSPFKHFSCNYSPKERRMMASNPAPISENCQECVDESGVFSISDTVCL
jgi:hypothetical protein